MKRSKPSRPVRIRKRSKNNEPEDDAASAEGSEPSSSSTEAAAATSSSDKKITSRKVERDKLTGRFVKIDKKAKPTKDEIKRDDASKVSVSSHTSANHGPTSPRATLKKDDEEQKHESTGISSTVFSASTTKTSFHEGLEEQKTANSTVKPKTSESRESENNNNVVSEERGNDGEDSSLVSNKQKIQTSAQTLIEKGVVEFSLGPIDAHLICSVCGGYYRDPHTTTTCFHTFCKSCIFQMGNVRSDGVHCPECKAFLGTLGKESSRVALFDRTFQEIIDKVVFPNLVKEDKENERAFYGKLDIALKPEYAKGSSPEQEPRRPTRRRVGKGKYMADDVNFVMKPVDPYEMPPLDRPRLQTQSSITVGQLKKYLMQKMPESVTAPSMVEILCNGVRLGEELSVFFILRTVWLETQNDLILTYQLAK